MKRTIGGVVALSVLAVLVVFGYYMWTFDYNPRPLDSDVDAGMPPMAEIQIERQGGISAVIHLRNMGRNRIRLADTVVLEPLYRIEVRYKAPGKNSFEPASCGGTMQTRGKDFDPKTDAVVELVPGAALSRRIAIGQVCDLSKEGRYSISLTYQPDTLKGTDALKNDIFTGKLMASTEFDVPLKSAEAPPKPAAK